jgi:hypothetical protein
MYDAVYALGLLLVCYTAIAANAAAIISKIAAHPAKLEKHDCEMVRKGTIKQDLTNVPKNRSLARKLAV